MKEVVEYIEKKPVVDFLKEVIKANKECSLPTTQYESVLHLVEWLPSIKKEYGLTDEEQKDWDDFIEKIFEEAKEVVEDEVD